VAVIWATVDRSAGKAGIKSFVVEKGRPGFKLEKLEHKLGVRASDTGTYVLDDCRIPKDNILGSAEIKQSTEGFKGAMKTFDNTRPLVASMALGVTRAALDLTREKIEESGIQLNYEKNPNKHKRNRKRVLPDGSPSGSHAPVNLARRLDDGQRRVQQSGSFHVQGQGRTLWNAYRSKCCELLGPLGFSCENLAEKWMRDVKITDIFEGTGQIQHLIVARNVLGYSSKQFEIENIFSPTCKNFACA